ncbi:MAG: SHOCT domain-containing protein [Candidatus Aminicenantales bacterium]
MFLGGMGILWLLLLGGAAFLFKESLQERGEGGAWTSESAMETLKRRYARGEIDRKEYEQRKRDLLE